MNTAALPPADAAGNIAGMIDLIILIAAGATIGGALFGLLALYNALGMAALWLAVGALYVVYFALQRRWRRLLRPRRGIQRRTNAAATRQAETTGTRSAPDRPVAADGVAGTEKIMFQRSGTDRRALRCAQPIAPPPGITLTPAGIQFRHIGRQIAIHLRLH
jgi:hypothetical protein